MAAVLLALGASVAWGLSDFLGGVLARRLPVAGVALLNQFAGLVAVGLTAAVAGEPLGRRALALGLVGGAFGGVGVASYLRALAVGTMSIVAPIAACGAVVTLALALAGGERPSPLALGGALVALGGAVLASFHEQRRGGERRQAVLLAVVTAFMFGGLLYFLGRASDEGGTLPALIGVRSASTAVLTAWALGLRPSVRLAPAAFVVAIALTGALSTGANGLYGLAAERGLLSIVSLLASLYPVTTVLLAYLALRERLTAVQAAGVVVALAGVSITVLA